MFIGNIDNLRYYCMVYNAMRTLEKVYDGSFDIIVFHDDCIDIENFYLNDRFNLKKDFPFVSFIKSDYDKKYELNRIRPYKHDGYMSKWYHLQECLKMQYNKVFFLDCDTVFIKNPSCLFDKYEDGILWGLSCVDPVHDLLFPEQANLNSGQFMIASESIKDHENLYDDIVAKRMYLSELARKKLFDKGIITDGELSGYDYFNEQYCGQMTILDNPNVVYENFNHREIVHPASPVEFLYDNQPAEVSEHKYYKVNMNQNGNADITEIFDETYIIHYSSGKSVFWVDQELRNQDLLDGYRTMYNSIKNKNNTDYENWSLLFQ